MERVRQRMREWFIEQRVLVGREQVNGQPINDPSSHPQQQQKNKKQKKGTTKIMRAKRKSEMKKNFCFSTLKIRCDQVLCPTRPQIGTLDLTPKEGGVAVKDNNSQDGNSIIR